MSTTVLKVDDSWLDELKHLGGGGDKIFMMRTISLSHDPEYSAILAVVFSYFVSVRHVMGTIYIF